MAWDTKHRPIRHSDVIGQEAHSAVLREFIRGGTGFQQSYIFCGSWGSGKTTMGRIHARALLCADPQEGNPCDACPSCIQILKTGSSDAFIEFDAATNSGKEDIKKIVESLQYATFSGQRRVYLIDESHQLSRSALDALLKVMEDNIPGSEDKWLICIFCTTEPNNMRDTVFSRCAPAFTIRKCSAEVVGARLAWICDQEGVEYDQDVLELISSVKKCHFRDAIKAVETISKFGKVNLEHTGQVLNLSAYGAYLGILDGLGKDEGACQIALDELLQTQSPASIYRTLSDLFMLAYRSALGVATIPAHLDSERVKAVGEWHGAYLLAFANRLSTRPARVSEATLRCDIAHLHQIRCGLSLPTAGRMTPNQAQTPSSTTASQQAQLSEASEAIDPGRVSRPRTRNVGGVHVDDRAVNNDPLQHPQKTPVQKRLGPPTGVLPPEMFRNVLEQAVEGLNPDGKGHTR